MNKLMIDVYFSILNFWIWTRGWPTNTYALIYAVSFFFEGDSPVMLKNSWANKWLGSLGLWRAGLMLISNCLGATRATASGKRWLEGRQEKYSTRWKSELFPWSPLSDERCILYVFFLSRGGAWGPHLAVLRSKTWKWWGARDLIV